MTVGIQEGFKMVAIDHNDAMGMLQQRHNEAFMKMIKASEDRVDWAYKELATR